MQAGRPTGEASVRYDPARVYNVYKINEKGKNSHEKIINDEFRCWDEGENVAGNVSILRYCYV